MSLADVLGQVMAVQTEADGALTVRHDGTVASLRRVPVAEGLEVISLTQALAWDLSATDELRERVAAVAGRTMFGTVTLTERPGGLADVMLRYNFPAGIDDPAMRILVLMVLAGGADAARTIAV